VTANTFRAVVAGLCFFTLAGCAPAFERGPGAPGPDTAGAARARVERPAHPGVAPSIPSTAPSYVPHRVYDTGEGAFTDFEALAATLAREDVVVFGEQHDDPGTHRMQRALLEALARRRGQVVLSLEMFERDVQPILDAYLAGDLTEDEFLAQARPWPNYATDYRPLVEFARAVGWPVVAANVPRRLAALVAREGLAALHTLPPEERTLAAATIDCPRDRYYENFAAAMRSHPTGEPGTAEEEEARIRRYYEAQCVKDETMAESIVATLEGLTGSQPDAARNAGSRPLIVHMTGAFHSDYALGTVERIRRRAPGRNIAVISAIPVADLDHPPVAQDRERADYVLFTLRP